MYSKMIMVFRKGGGRFMLYGGAGFRIFFKTCNIFKKRKVHPFRFLSHP
jgi:hypothetical protein